MLEQNLPWVISCNSVPPDEFVQAVNRLIPNSSGLRTAQLLWHRGIQNPEQIAGFLKPSCYQPQSPFAFGQEMEWAVERLKTARERREKVAIWGDFDADGVTATSVLWDGLRPFFPDNLCYSVPNRLTESHGLNGRGIQQLSAAGVKVIVTCDTGSTNPREVELANSLGIDVIVTDHHTLPVERPPVTAIINPRYLPKDHPLFHLSGVAVAYKLVEAVYQGLPGVARQPLEDLLDLVAIGLIADLVELKGDCRYLAQLGIQRLQQDFRQAPELRRRPGVGYLLEFCQKNGDRPTDISFGLGPRINAISRIQGDATFCVELLTSRDLSRCWELAETAELANTRRKALQKEIADEAIAKLNQLDLSTTRVIVLEDSQWAVGVLGLVAAQLAQEYARPAILLSTEIPNLSTPNSQLLARGSARSFGQIDLYELVQSQAHLLYRFGGHPYAAGLSLPVENLPLFTEAINQQLRNRETNSSATITADLIVTVADLGKDLFNELRWLEPCGMGNPVPKLLIQNCWFERVGHKNIQDLKGSKIRYIKTTFLLRDDFSESGFKGVWWGHYKEEIPLGRCDVIVELDHNSVRKDYEVRLVAVRASDITPPAKSAEMAYQILDWRDQNLVKLSQLGASPTLPMILNQSPNSWDELYHALQIALQQHKPLALAYPPPELTQPLQIWQNLLGIAKYLSRTGKIVTFHQLQGKLGIGETALNRGLAALRESGFKLQELNETERTLQMTWHPQDYSTLPHHLSQFLAAIRQEQFIHQYFYNVPVETIERGAVAGD